ncbi:MAG: hypothetical protein M3M87_01530 [Thermoproteota archaeon]|nr:hypothetical protein [Thermoproteota archaeon]
MPHNLKVIALDASVYYDTSDNVRHKVIQARKINHLLYYDRAGFGML